MANILVVDDEKSIRISLREFLRDADYEVGTAEDADQAIEMMGAADFDVVLADIILPRVTGVNLLKAIKETFPHVQVILITGEPTIATATEAVRADAFDYVAKPIGKEKLLRVVAHAAKFKALDDERRRLDEENRRHREKLERLVEERSVALRASNRALVVLSECCHVLVRATSENRLRHDERSAEASCDPAFIHEILAALESAQQRAAQTAAEPSAVAIDPELVEILSLREIEIVGLLAERLRDKEIAERLIIAPETVKSHLRNIYWKLDAHNRRQAVSRAFDFGLLKPPR